MAVKRGMSKSRVTLKKRILELLREDEEFRLAVAGLLNLEEILKTANASLQELARLREDMLAGFRRHDEELARVWSELEKLREDMLAGFKRHDEELARLREDMLAGFRRHDEELARVWSELEKLREDMLAGFKRHDEELARVWSELEKLWTEVQGLRADFNKGFDRLNRRLDALGARWGIMAESAFREGLRGLLKDFGIEVERWSAYDEEGKVYGHGSLVELDIAVKDGEIILVEISSHVKLSDVATFKRKAEFYAEKTGRRPDRLVLVSPYIDEDALTAARKLGIEIFTTV